MATPGDLAPVLNGKMASSCYTILSRYLDGSITCRFLLRSIVVICPSCATSHVAFLGYSGDKNPSRFSTDIEKAVQ
jgi:hypothetical protein